MTYEYEVKKCGYENLSNEIKKAGVLSDNGCGMRYAIYLAIYHKGKLLRVYSDAMEPEDARFSRDLSWIKETLEEAYKIGYSDAIRDKEENLGNV